MQNRNKYTEIEHFIANESFARGFVLTKIKTGRMDIGKCYSHKLVEEARTWVLAMNVSQAMISSKDTQSALEAIWNKIDEKKQNQPYRCDSSL
jgi:hypothetical protein